MPESAATHHTQLYDDDFVLWLQEAVTLLRAQQYHEVDWPHLLDEIESIVAYERRDLDRYFTRRFHIKLGLACQGRATTDTIRRLLVGTFEANMLEGILEDNPSLRPRLTTILPAIYTRYRTKHAWLHSRLPVDCPWTVDQILDDTLYPLLQQEPSHGDQ